MKVLISKEKYGGESGPEIWYVAYAYDGISERTGAAVNLRQIRACKRKTDVKRYLEAHGFREEDIEYMDMTGAGGKHA